MKPSCLPVKGTVLASLLFLAGCSQEFATLHFDNAVDRRFQVPGREEKMDYREALLDELSKRDVNVEQLEVLPDKKDAHALHLRVSRSLDPLQRARIQHYLAQQLDDRKAASYAATLDTYPERVKLPEGRGTPDLSERARTFSLEPQGQPTINILRVGNYIELVLNTTSSLMQCEVSYSLEKGLPFYTVRRVSDEPGQAQKNDHNAEVTGRVSQGAYAGVIEADLRFHDPKLARLVDEGKVDVRMKSRPFKGIEDLNFIIDGLGHGSHQNGALSSGAYYARQRQCDELARDLGRPFSFHMGEGLDRLSRVTFKGGGST